MMHYRPATNQDLTHLRDLDLKCHEQEPSSQKWWQQIAADRNSGCCVACKSQVPIGMLVWQFQKFKLDDWPKKLPTLHIHKLCVRHEFRKQGVARRLLGHAHEDAKKNEAEYMTISVPEYRCRPETKPDADVSVWLNKMGFQARMILPLKVSMYGEEYDQFLFVFEVQ